MKKLIYLIVAIAILGLIIPGCIPVVPPTEQNEPGTLPNKATINVNPGDSIQAAINAADPYDTINVAAGTYDEGSLVFNEDYITLIGSGANTTTIITSSTNYGVYVPSGVDNITIKDFTIEEDESNNGDVCLPSGTSRFHLKISHNSGFTLENVKLHGPGKEFSCITGLDLHTVQDVTIKNVEITGYSKNGVGVTATTSGLLFEDVTIDNNGYTDSTGWAGISFYTKNGGNITNVQFKGTNTISNNPMGVFIENLEYYVGGEVNIIGTGTATLSGNLIPLVATILGDLSIVDVYAKDVFNVPVRLENAFESPEEYAILASYWHNVTSAGLAANNPLANGNPVIFNLTNEEWYVVEGMNIQAAIDVASDGDTINVTAGTYNENVIIKNFNGLTVKAVKGDTVTVQAGWNIIQVRNSSSVTIEGLTIAGKGGGTVADGATGIMLRDSHDCKVLKNVITDLTHEGIYLRVKSSGNLVKENKISDIWWGIVLNDADENDVLENEISDSLTGILVVNAASNNLVKENEVSADFEGIFLLGADENTVQENEVSDIRFGIVLNGANDNNVLENEVADSIVDGIHAWSSTDNLIKENEVSDSGRYDLYDSSAPVPLDNTWEDNEYEKSNF